MTFPTAASPSLCPKWPSRAASAPLSRRRPRDIPAHAFWFGEDQARYIVATAPERTGAILAAAQTAGVACRRLGETGGPTLTLGGETAILLSDLVGNFEEWLPDYMAGAL